MTAHYFFGTARAARSPVTACTCDFEPSEQHEGACALQYDLSAYLDGERQGSKLAVLEALLSKNADSCRELNAIRGSGYF